MTNQKLTVKKPRTHAPGEVASIRGKGKPGTKVTVTGLKNPVTKRPKKQRANVSGQGNWGVNGLVPQEEGVHTISVESSGATTSTTYAVRVHGRPRKKKKKK